MQTNTREKIKLNTIGQMKLNKTKYSTKQIFLWLWHHHYGCRMQAILNAVLGLALVGISIVNVDTVRTLTDIATGSRDGSLMMYAVLLACVFIVEMLLHVASTWISSVLGVKAQNVMQRHFFSNLLNAQWRGMEKFHSGDVLNRLFADVTDIVRLLTEVVPSVLIVVVQFLASFMYLYVMDRNLAVILIITTPVFILLSRIYFHRMRKIVRHIKDSNSALQSIIQESVQNRMVIKTLGRTDDMIDKLANRQNVLCAQVKSRSRFAIISKVFVNIGFAGAYLVALICGLHELKDGLITVGVLMAFTQLINRIQRPLLDMARMLPVFVNSMTSCERLMELEALPKEQKHEAITAQTAVGIRFKNVDYAYPAEPGRSGRTVLQNFSYDFIPGSFTAILGETGAGKTTLVRMILALIDPLKGEVELYDSDSSTQLNSSVRDIISYVPQGNTLFSGSIRENLLMGNPDATTEQMYEALRLAKADFVFEIKGGIDALCSENGGGLSDGQAQRIAIARALLHPCSILLLDEATSSLDPATEFAILENIKSRYKDRTVIFVTHRVAVTEFTTHTVTLTRIK